MKQTIHTQIETIMPAFAKLRHLSFSSFFALLYAIMLNISPTIGIRKANTKPTMLSAERLPLFLSSILQPQLGQITASSITSLPHFEQYFILSLLVLICRAAIPNRAARLTILYDTYLYMSTKNIYIYV